MRLHRGWLIHVLRSVRYLPRFVSYFTAQEKGEAEKWRPGLCRTPIGYLDIVCPHCQQPRRTPNRWAFIIRRVVVVIRSRCCARWCAVSHLRRQRAHNPATLGFWLPAGHGLHFLPDRGVVFRRPTETRRITKSVQSLGGKGSTPFAHGHLGNPLGGSE